MASSPVRGLDLAAAMAAPSGTAVLRDLLAAGPVELRAEGVSMRPLLRPGDRVCVAARPPRRGEIALAVVGGRLVLHRLVRRRGGSWLLRGDARSHGDGWVGAGQILGVVTARRPRTGERSQSGWRRIDRRRHRWLGLGWARLSPLIRRARASRDGGPARWWRGAGGSKEAASAR